MIAVLNRPHEFKGHVRGALISEAGREEIRDVCMQIAVYYESLPDLILSVLHWE